MADCEEVCGFYFVFSLCTYYIWMDLTFFGELADHGSLYNSSAAHEMMFPVKSIKLRMQDHTDHYVNLPLMELADEKLRISSIPGVSPNLISGVHLLFAIFASKLMTSANLGVRRVGVSLYLLRNALDILDGVVHRAQSNNRGTFTTTFGSKGYLIDAFCDICGGLLATLACTVFLLRNPPLKRVDRTRSSYGHNKVGDDAGDTSKMVHWSHREIIVRMAAVTVQVMIRTALWDHFQKSYVELLETPKSNVPRDMQGEVLNYHSTWLVLWLWKISSADAIMQFNLLAILFDKLWIWIQVLNTLGIIELVLTFLLACYHLMEARTYLSANG